MTPGHRSEYYECYGSLPRLCIYDEFGGCCASALAWAFHPRLSVE